MTQREAYQSAICSVFFNDAHWLAGVVATNISRLRSRDAMWWTEWELKKIEQIQRKNIVAQFHHSINGCEPQHNAQFSVFLSLHLQMRRALVCSLTVILHDYISQLTHKYRVKLDRKAEKAGSVKSKALIEESKMPWGKPAEKILCLFWQTRDDSKKSSQINLAKKQKMHGAVNNTVSHLCDIPFLVENILHRYIKITPGTTTPVSSRPQHTLSRFK